MENLRALIVTLLKNTLSDGAMNDEVIRIRSKIMIVGKNLFATPNITSRLQHFRRRNKIVTVTMI